MSIPTSVQMLPSALDPIWLNQIMPEALNGTEQTFTGPDALWGGQLTIYCRNAAARRAWKGFIDAREGTLNTFDFYPTRWIWCGIPVADAPADPPTTWDSTTVTWDSTAVTWDEGSGATDAPITFNASQGTTSLTVTHSGVAAKWQAGILFNIGNCMYRVAEVTSVAGDNVTMKIMPRLRTDVTAGTLLTEAHILAKKTRPREGEIQQSNQPVQVTMAFVEDPQ